MCAPGWMSRTLVALQMHVRVRQRAVVTSESIGFAYATRIRCYEVTVLYTRSGMWKVYRGDAYMFYCRRISLYSFLFAFFGLQAREPRNGPGQLHLELDLAVSMALGCAARRVAVGRRARGAPAPLPRARRAKHDGSRHRSSDVRASIGSRMIARQLAGCLSLCDGQFLSAISHVPRTCACQM